MTEHKKLTGYPSIDKPWLKYYSEEVTNVQMPSGSMYDYLKDCNKDAYDDLAITYFHRKITYRNLIDSIDEAAAAFASLGVKQGNIVSLVLPNIPENVYCLYALNKLGAVADFIDLRSKGEALVRYLTETEAKVAVICDMFAENAFEIKDKTNIEHYIVVSAVESLNPIIRAMKKTKVNMPENAFKWREFIKSGKGRRVSPTGDAESISCIFHTSGTTGHSKGAMFSNRGCNAMPLQSHYVPLKFERGKVMMNQVPPFLAFNIVCSLHLPLCKHMKIFMLPDYRSNEFAKRIVRAKANACLAGPADWGNFLENEKLMKKKIDLSGLTTPLCGSDAISLEKKLAVEKVLAQKGFKGNLYEGYGMTEIGSAACSNMPGHVEPKSIGVPFCFNTFCIWDTDNDVELPYMEKGEICMTGPTLMVGYYNNPEETSNALRVHPDGITWLHSGDIGHIDENGFIYIEGRIKRTIVRNEGFKISPFEVEKVIMALPDVEACCVVGVSDKKAGFGQLPFAFFVAKQGVDITEQAVEQHCKNELVEMYVPVGYMKLNEMLLTPNGKVDYRALEKLAEEKQ